MFHAYIYTRYQLSKLGFLLQWSPQEGKYDYKLHQKQLESIYTTKTREGSVWKANA